MLARKISRAMWDRRVYLADDDIRADALTRCLKTRDDILSWWGCTGDKEDVAEVALALAIPENKSDQRLDKVDVVVVPSMELESAGLSFEHNEGRTVVDDLRSRHVDVVHLDVERLTNIARFLAPRIRSGEHVYSFTQAQVKGLLREALLKNRISRERLDDRILTKLEGRRPS